MLPFFMIRMITFDLNTNDAKALITYIEEIKPNSRDVHEDARFYPPGQVPPPARPRYGVYLI